MTKTGVILGDQQSPQGNGVLTNFGEGAYLCVHAFANAVNAAGTTEAEAIVQALERARVTGPQGEVLMDAATHHASVNTYLACCNADGTFRIVEHFGRNPPIIPARYLGQALTTIAHAAPVSPELTARLAAELGTAARKVDTAKHILSVADVAVLTVNAEGIISDSNRSAAMMFGYAVGELTGMSVHLLLPPHLRQGHAGRVKGFVEGEQKELNMAARRELTGYRKDGSFFPLQASIAKVRSDNELLLVVTLQDITERKHAEDELIHRANHDSLTGLPNRALIRERLTSALHRSRRSGLHVALLFVDLDRFKLINDTHGHEMGDMLLKAVANRLITQVRPGDTVAHLAGDEFVILCEQVEQPVTISTLAVRITQILRSPFVFDTLELFVTASIGVAIGSGLTHSADVLMRQADTAMYSAKEKGRNGWQFFSNHLEDQARQRLAITNGLRMAIARNELSPRFQPIIVAETGRIVGAELLLRWRPPEGEVSPAVFIPIAETTGSIVSIGAWVFRQACRAEVDWRKRWGANAPYVSVNLSARQLNEQTLADDFATIMQETGADPTRLVLEITETALMADVETNLHILRRLASLGLQVAVDDFGTGYSSLAQLTRLPVNVLKIDRAFIDGIDKSEESRAIIRAVIGLGRALGLKTVAEGVENSAQHRELCVHGCDFIQGYYFHRPLEENVFVETMDRELQAALPGEESSLYFLLYVSRATRPLADDELAALLRQARTFNRSAGLSGCLLYQNGHFMQMLEGKRAVLYALMDKIRADPRHDSLRIVIEGRARRRVFRDWGMMQRSPQQDLDEPDFSPWQQRSIHFLEMGEDARTCYLLITSYAVGGTST